MNKSTVFRCLVFIALLTQVSARAHDHDLLLRVQDAVGAPGGQTVITLRTYSTRPVGQGTICMRFDPTLGQVPPLSSLKGVKVFGQADDVIQSFTTSEQNGALIIDVVFESASASINLVDGPFAAFYFDVAPDAPIGQEMEIRIDPGVTGLLDENGFPIPIELRSGELTIRDPALPVEIAAEAHLPDFPDMPVTLSLQTNEPFAIGSGQVGIRYSSRELTGEHILRSDPRFGRADIKMDGHAGLAIFNIVTTDHAFNELPGNILSIDVQPNPAFAFGQEPEIYLDPAFTHLFDREGRWIPVTIEDAVYALPNTVAPPKDEGRTKQRQRK
ncbi:MAG: hypothetical protein AB8G17_20265 [Gammaproteobacteria bacterium]